MLRIHSREKIEELHVFFSKAVMGLIEKRQAAGLKTAIALSGGSTPAGFYKSLAAVSKSRTAAGVSWERVSFFMGDERHVPLDSAESNYANALANLCYASAIPERCLHPLDFNKKTPREVAADYEEKILVGTGGSGKFDLVVLGMGPDGHTASIFPATPQYTRPYEAAVSGSTEKIETGSVFFSHYVPGPDAVRYSLTLRAILAAENAAVLVTGQKKAPMLSEALNASPPSHEIPVSLVFSAYRNGERPLTLITDIAL